MRSGLAAGVRNVDGLRCSEFVADQVTCPMGALRLEDIDYDLVFADGPATYQFVLTVYLMRANEKGAQQLADAYAEPTGATSVKAAVETAAVAAAMGVDSINVKTFKGIGTAKVGDVDYLAVQFEIEVIES